jgi:hypothetical protein
MVTKFGITNCLPVEKGGFMEFSIASSFTHYFSVCSALWGIRHQLQTAISDHAVGQAFVILLLRVQPQQITGFRGECVWYHTLAIMACDICVFLIAHMRFCGIPQSAAVVTVTLVLCLSVSSFTAVAIASDSLVASPGMSSHLAAWLLGPQFCVSERTNKRHHHRAKKRISYQGITL